MISDALPPQERKEHEAAVLLLRGGAATFLGSQEAFEALWQEQSAVEYDRRFFDRGQTKNKRARYNICFGPDEKAASEDFKQPTVKSFRKLPMLQKFREALVDKLGAKAADLN